MSAVRRDQWQHGGGGAHSRRNELQAGQRQGLGDRIEERLIDLLGIDQDQARPGRQRHIGTLLGRDGAHADNHCLVAQRQQSGRRLGLGERRGAGLHDQAIEPVREQRGGRNVGRLAVDLAVDRPVEAIDNKAQLEAMEIIDVRADVGMGPFRIECLIEVAKRNRSTNCSLWRPGRLGRFCVGSDSRTLSIDCRSAIWS